MKTNLGTGYIISGFDTKDEQKYFAETTDIGVPLFYGKTSEIPEDIAKKCVIVGKYTNLYKDYELEFTNLYETAKESIQSACNQIYCIIYKQL